MVAPAPEGVARLDERFLFAGLLLTLVGGTALGAVHLLWVQGLRISSPLTHAQAHAHAQVFGFLGTFVVTFGLHLLPRFVRRPLPHPRLAAWTPPLLLAGAWLHFLGQPGTRWETGYLLMGLSGPLVAAGTVAFAWNVIALLRGFESRDGFEPFVRLGAFWFAVAGVMDAVLGPRAFFTHERLYPYPWAQALWHAAVFGGVTLFGIGLAAHLALPMLGGGFVRRRTLRWGWRVLVGAVPIEVGGWLLSPGSSLQEGFLAVGHLTCGVGLLVTVAAFAFPATRPAGLDQDRLFTAALVAALALLGAAGAARLAMGLAELGGRVFDPTVHDAVRHLVTVGFLLNLTVGMAARLWPALRGGELRWRGLGWAALALLWLSVVARSSEVLASVGHMEALRVSAASGVVAWVALVLFTLMMGATIRRGRPLAVGGER